MNKKEFLREKETNELKNSRIDSLRRFNKVRNDVIKGHRLLDYEYAKEFYLVKPHDNDLYNQN